MKTRMFLLVLLSLRLPAQEADYTPYVKPMVGTGGHGHTFPGAVVPFGMVQLSPDTRNDGSWDGCSGYHYSDSLIYGFSHTHLSGTGCSDYGDILLMPTLKKPAWDRAAYPARFSHKGEKASAGYYSVKFSDDPVLAELTTTARVGFHKYTFLREGSASVFLDLTHRDKLLEGEIKRVDEKTIEVFRRSEAWAKNQYCYARIECSKPFRLDKNADGIRAFLGFAVKKGEAVMFKVALSQVDYEGAKKNMQAELPHWDFVKVRQEAREAWNRELSKIEVKTKNIAYLQNFYTALYHCMIHPSLSSDVDLRYRGNDLKVHTGKRDHYTVFSLWDTFRALHPLFTIIEQKRSGDFIQTFLDIYKESGMLPVWELSGNETYCMIGYHSASVIADALVKGIGDYDTLAVLEALVSSSTAGRAAISKYATKGYLAADDEPESVSKTLEYAYDDWCIAQVARAAKKQDVYLRYMKRAGSWANVFDKQTGFMRPRYNGGWYSPFDPREVNNHYTEANSWQYSFFVPHDLQALVQAHGGEAAFEKKLDQLFAVSSKTTGRQQADISGLIGQYAHGNEPSHHMSYLYTLVGAGAKTQKLVWKLLHEMYQPRPAGLCGNEDCGQMSAWYVMSSIGFYPVTPGLPQYAIGTCLFDEVAVHLENGNTFTVKTSRSKPGDFYVKKVSLSNNPFQPALTQLHHMDIMRGGTFEMMLTGEPKQTTFGKNPKLMEAKAGLLSAPVLNGERVFRDSALVTIAPGGTDVLSWCSLNGQPVKRCEKPFAVKETSTILAYSTRGNDTSAISEGTFYRLMHPEWKVLYNYKYNSQYQGGGEQALIDGIYGDVNWRKGSWQGLQGKDVELLLDLGRETSVGTVVLSALQDTRSWIVFPQRVTVMYSADAKTYKTFGETKNSIPADSMEVQTQKLTMISAPPVQARYLKLKLVQFGKLPEWHPGKGGDSFIFIDEIEVK
jgi:predicted alpha-1,2-mannosidase